MEIKITISQKCLKRIQLTKRTRTTNRLIPDYKPLRYNESGKPAWHHTYQKQHNNQRKETNFTSKVKAKWQVHCLIKSNIMQIIF